MKWRKSEEKEIKSREEKKEGEKEGERQKSVGGKEGKGEWEVEEGEYAVIGDMKEEINRERNKENRKHVKGDRNQRGVRT